MTRISKHRRDPPREAGPLPTSLTRFLSDSTAAIAAPFHDEPAQRGRPTPTSPNIALRLAIGWAIIYNIAGGAILWWLWSTMG